MKRSAEQLKSSEATIFDSHRICITHAGVSDRGHVDT